MTTENRTTHYHTVYTKMLMLENLCLTPQMSYKGPLHTTHQTAKIFRKKIGEQIVAHVKNCQKNSCSCEKKLKCVWKITAFFAVLCVVCEGLYGTGVYILVKNKTEFEVLRTLHTTMTFTNIFLKKSLRK